MTSTKKYRHRKSIRHADLFSWRPTIRDAAPLAVRKLAGRFGISIAHAATVADLAGIGAEVRR
jgi:hypothetical protein